MTNNSKIKTYFDYSEIFYHTNDPFLHCIFFYIFFTYLFAFFIAFWNFTFLPCIHVCVSRYNVKRIFTAVSPTRMRTTMNPSDLKTDTPIIMVKQNNSNTCTGRQKSHKMTFAQLLHNNFPLWRLRKRDGLITGVGKGELYMNI